ncbi:hypothetical protein [Pedobacter sp. Leaf176]|uniref:hypothetical protein n=1 Tax=Pedobacter sp. Leaf176 TaxID=1736286 RepID=UPI0006F3CC5E|nr:hypothetical protein [Pedobacter sp. Leaf176]KQR66970.1 hypothetical protein ASF92_19675 [Pedobacter sp. Leaf176]
MSRNIIKILPGSVTASSNGNTDDPYMAKLVKLVPAEIISIYLAVFTVLKGLNGNPEGNNTLQWIVFVLMLIITPFYLRKVAKIESWRQISVSTFSFIFWVFSMGGPLEGQLILGYTAQTLGAVFLPIYTLVAPWIYDA